MRFKLYRCIACVILFLGGILVFGSSNVFAAITELTPLAEFTGETSGDYFGYSISSAGDVNGDGYKDVIVGANTNDQGGNNAGRAYVFYGGASLINKSASDADVIFTGETASDQFGMSVSGAGDLNDDGYDDVIVGASLNDQVGNASGRTYIFYGGSSLTSKSASDADVIFTGEAADDRFGRSTSSAGDVNKDGYDDVIVGAWYYPGGSQQGRVYIFYGGSSMSSKSASDANVTFTGEAVGDKLSYGFPGVSKAGDVNGDGYDDVIVGGRSNDQGGSNAGRVYIFYGGYSISSKNANLADVVFTGEVAEGVFGTSVSSARDVNNDDYNDVLVGASAYNSNQGRAYIFYGGSSLTSRSASDADVIFTGEAADDHFGYSTSLTSDVNNDGYDDVVVGAPYYPGGIFDGRAYIFYGQEAMSSKSAGSAEIILEGENDSDFLAHIVSSAGDVDSDGWEEWLVGAPDYPDGGMQGKAYLYNLNYASPSIAMNDSFYVNTTSSAITGTTSETGVNVSGVQISVNNGAWTSCSASDGTFNSANEAFSCSLSGLTEGTYSLRVRSYDENGVYVPSALYATADLVVDFTPPSDGVVAISAGGSYTNSQTVTLNISAFDALAGVSQMMISEDPNFEGAEWQAYLETVEFTLSGESGTKVIYVRFMDRAGNVSGVYSISIELLTETGGDMSRMFILGLMLLAAVVFTAAVKFYKRI